MTRMPVAASQSASSKPVFVRSDLVILGGSALAVVLAAISHYGKWGAIQAFGFAALAVAMLASLVGRSVEQLGDRLGAGATGVLQSTLGNLPELFIGFFALKAGLIAVVQASIIGSILANALLIMGAAFVVGGLRHGTQKFDSGMVRSTVVMLFLATSALVLPALAHLLHEPVSRHEKTLSIIIALVLLAIYLLSLPMTLRRSKEESQDVGWAGHEPPRWPLALAIGLLVAAGGGAAFVSDWFVAALQPTIQTLHLSETFTGLVVIAIFGNAIENVVGVQLAARNQMNYAMSVIVNSPLQIALFMAPLLVLLSLFTATTLTLIFAPLLIAAVLLTVVIVALVTLDGESNWLEGAVIIGLYAVIATLFWWG